MRTSRMISAAALAATAALVLVGCSTSAPSAAKSGNATQLSFLTFETPSLDATFWDASIKHALEDMPGVTVDKIISPDADRTAYAKQLQASGQFPDVLSSIGARDFLDAKLLVPFKKSWLKDNFILPFGNEVKGETYAPPTNAQLLPLVYYNKAIFAANNLDVPTTWDEFVQDIKTLKAAGVTPMELGGAEPWAAGMPLVALASADVLGQDPKWIQKRYDGKVHFTDPLFANAMQKAVDLVKMGAYDPAALSVDFATANKNFLDGKSAMYVQGSWMTGSGYISEDAAKNVGAFPWPTDDGAVVVPSLVGGTTSVSSESKHVDTAMTFAQNWSLDPRNMSKLIESDGAIPMMKKLKLEDYDVKVSSLYQEVYKLATADNNKVSAFAWVGNDDSLAPGINDEFYALSQAFFSNSDVKSQLAQLDSDWDAATAK